MIFTYKKWESFCYQLKEAKTSSISASELLFSKNLNKFLILKHDIETNLRKAYKFAKIEKKYNHKGSFYIQAYLLKSSKNIKILRDIKKMGHEVSYHHDVMDANKGNLEAAIVEFEKNKALFEKNGFELRTVCQHGNPIIKRISYTSNRDFFRSEKVRKLYPNINDIMVDFKEKVNVDYQYISDSGRKFKNIYDPINNDVIDSEDKNIIVDDFDILLKYATMENCIISIHPHRWAKYASINNVKSVFFKAIKFIAKVAAKIPLLNKIMSRFYYLAKKI